MAADSEPTPAPGSKIRKRSGTWVKSSAMNRHTPGGVKTCPFSFRASTDVAFSYCR